MAPDDQTAPDIARQLLDLGCDLEFKGELANAVRLFGQSLQAYPTAEGFVKRAHALEKLGRYSLALADYRRALAAAPGDRGASEGIRRVRRKSN